MSTDDEIKSRLKDIFPDATVQSKIVNMVVSKRPLGWSHKSNAPYFKEIFGKQLKSEIDKMMSSGEGIIFRYSKWCNDQNGMTPNTLYTRINQSIRYVLECLDPDGIYKQWYQTVRIKREPNLGVCVRYIPGFNEEGINGFVGETIIGSDEGPRWKREMDEWIEGDDRKPFIQENLALTPTEITELKIQIAQLSNIMSSITSSCVKLIKTS